MRAQGVVLPTNQPQILAQIGGITVPGVTFFDVENFGYFAADRFRIGFAIGAAEFATAQFFSSLGLQTITIEVALSGHGFVTLITGQVDNIEIDFGRNVAVLCGRDLSARLIDAEISIAFINQTASQVATQLAEEFGLTPNVSATSTIVGQYYEIDHARTVMNLHSRNMTAWNLLSSLAYIEGFNLSVTGEELYFGPPVVTTPLALCMHNFSSLIADTAATVPTGTTVKSWNTRNKSAVEQSAGEGGAPVIIRPNLSSSQAGSLAAVHLGILSQHKTVLIGTMPADLTTLPGQKIVLSGTESLFDQTYTVEVIRRSVQARRGFKQVIRAFASS